VSDKDDLEVRFGVRLAELITGLKEAGEAVEGSVSAMNASFAALGSTIELVMKPLLAFTAVLAGGTAFKEFIDKSNEFNTDAVKMATTLNITGQAAGNLGVALNSVGVTQEAFLGTLQKFDRQLKNNEQSLKSMGLATRDENGNLKETLPLFLDAIQLVGSYAQGHDRNTAAIQMFGRAGADMNKLLKLNSELLEEAARKAAALGLTVTSEGVAATLKYNMGLRESHDVTLAISKAFGDVLVPMLTKLTASFNEAGPTIATAFREVADVLGAVMVALGSTLSAIWDLFAQLASGVGIALQSILQGIKMVFGGSGEGVTALEFFMNTMRIISITFIALSDIIQWSLSVIKTAFQVVADVAVGAATVINRMLSGDRAGAIAAVQQTIDKVKETAAKGLADLARIAEDGKKKFDEALTKDYTKLTGTPAGLLGPQGDKRMPEKDKGLAKANAAVEAAQAKADLALEKELLKEAEAAVNDLYKNNLITIKQYYASKLVTARKALDDEIVAVTKQLDAQKALVAKEAKQDPVKAKEAYAKQVTLEGRLMVLSTQRKNVVVENAREMADAELKLTNQLETTKIDLQEQLALKQLDVDKANVKQRVALRQLDTQGELTEYKRLEDAKWALEQDFYAKKRALQGLSEVEKAKLDADELKAQQDHNAAILDLNRQLQLDSAKYALQAQQTMESSFSTFLQDAVNGTKTLSQAWHSLVTSVTQAITKMMADKLVQQFMNGGASDGGFGGLIGQVLGFLGGGASAGAGSLAGASGNAAQGINFGGFRAAGGPTDAGLSYIVGERGPELFTPNTSGVVSPGGGTTHISVKNTFHVNGPIDSRTQQQIAAQTASALQRAAKRNS